MSLDEREEFEKMVWNLARELSQEETYECSEPWWIEHEQEGVLYV